MQCFKTYGYRFKTVRFSKIGNVINYIILIFKFDFFFFLFESQYRGNGATCRAVLNVKQKIMELIGMYIGIEF